MESTILYSNYYEDLEKTARENLAYEGNENPSDDDVTREMQSYDDLAWEEWSSILDDVFKGFPKMIAVGSVGRWDGNYTGGFLFDTLDQFLNKAAEDCYFIKFYEKKGHLYFKGVHHDGEVNLEIKGVSNKGTEYFENWEFGPESDKRTEEYVHTQIIKRYSRIPNVVKLLAEGKLN